VYTFYRCCHELCHNTEGNALPGDAVQRVGITESGSTPTLCSEQGCGLYPAWYVHNTQQLRAEKMSTFVSVLYPHDRRVAPDVLAESVKARCPPPPHTHAHRNEPPVATSRWRPLGVKAQCSVLDRNLRSRDGCDSRLLLGLKLTHAGDAMAYLSGVRVSYHRHL